VRQLEIKVLIFFMFFFAPCIVIQLRNINQRSAHFSN